MKKIILIVVVIAVLAIFYFWSNNSNDDINQEANNANKPTDINIKETESSSTPDTAANPVMPEPTPNNTVQEEILKIMTLEEKVGQMFMLGFLGTEPDYYISKMIKERNIGGVILMKNNFSDLEQTKELINKLQQMSLETAPSIPLFISTDQEGGDVVRVRVKGVKEFTSQPDIKTTDQAYLVAETRANELVPLGINVNYSPVVDYSQNTKAFLYGRTFRGNMTLVGQFSSSMVKGYQENSLISGVKHFLGHPDTNMDPHTSILEATFSNQELIDRINIFKKIITDASPKMIMISHVIYTNIDGNNPCSLSKICIQDWLREKAGYNNGIVITDGMEMGAITEKYTNSGAAVKAVQAGEDILLYTGAPEKQAEAYDAIIQAVKDGEISIEQIDSSVLKILKLKKDLPQ